MAKQMTRAEVLALLKKRGGNDAAVMHAYLSVPDEERRERREAALSEWRKRVGLEEGGQP